MVIVMNQVKTCSKCLNQKTLLDFSKRKASKDGFEQRCKACRKSYQDSYIYSADKATAARQRYYQKNKKTMLEYSREYQKSRSKVDLEFRLAQNLRSRLRSAIRYNLKKGSAIRDLGCSVSELKIHLESKFTDGMSWENYGKWHIDHIKPLIQFDLNNRTEFLIATHYTNLQPLWAIDNLRKPKYV